MTNSIAADKKRVQDLLVGTTLVQCLDGPCVGESHPVPDDAKIGHTIVRAVPFDSDPEAPVFHRPAQRLATYVLSFDGLRHAL